jgi:hypothetical protein
MGQMLRERVIAATSCSSGHKEAMPRQELAPHDHPPHCCLIMLARKLHGKPPASAARTHLR